MSRNLTASLGGRHTSKRHKNAKPKIHSIHLHKAHSGGYIAVNNHLPDENGITPEPEEHLLPDLDAIRAHIDRHFSGQPNAPEGEEPEEPQPEE
jgi:hypothetical protein